MRTIRRILAALDRDVSIGRLYAGWFTLLGVVGAAIGLLAIGAR